MGVALGLLAGFYGGVLEAVIMRATDLLLAFPYFLLTIVFVAVLGPSLLNAMIAIAAWTAPHYVRLVRSVVLSVKGREFVEAARALGRPEFGILTRHILPACVPTLVVQAAIFCAQNMLMGASLSFLGLGAQPPSPELGAMLGAGRQYLRVAPQVVAVPAVGIFLGVLAFNFLGDALRDHLDPDRRAGRVKGPLVRPAPPRPAVHSLTDRSLHVQTADHLHRALGRRDRESRPRRGLVRAPSRPGSDPRGVLHARRSTTRRWGRPGSATSTRSPGPMLFATQGYRDVAAKDTEGPAVIALLTSRSNTIYDQVLTVNVPPVDADWADGGRAGGVTAPALSTARFDLPDGDEAALLEWYRTREFPRLQGQQGFRAGRLCRQGPPHPVAASRDPRWFVINEWEGVMAAMADGTAKEALARHEAGLAGRLSRFAYNVARRHFALARTVSRWLRWTAAARTPCPLGVNGGEFPHWSVGQICDLAVKIGAQFVELSVRRVMDAGAGGGGGGGSAPRPRRPRRRDGLGALPTPSRRRAPSRRP